MSFYGKVVPLTGESNSFLKIQNRTLNISAIRERLTNHNVSPAGQRPAGLIFALDYARRLAVGRHGVADEVKELRPEYRHLWIARHIDGAIPHDCSQGLGVTARVRERLRFS